MSEHKRSNNNKTFSIDTTDTADILKKIQYQLDAIERKVDSLVKSSGPRDYKGGYSSTPRRDSDNSKRSFKTKHANRKERTSSEGKFYHGRSSGPGPKKNQAYRNARGKKT